MSGQQDSQQTTNGDQRAESQLRAVLESALDCIISMDHRGRVVEFNQAAEEAFGYAREDVLGTELAEQIVPEAYRADHRAGLDRYLETGEAGILGERIRTFGLRADGSEFPIELSITLSTSTAQPIFTAFIRDVTEQENAEDALRRSQRTLVTLLSNLPGMAYRCVEDRYWALSFASEGCEELTGYTSEELIDREGFSYGHLIHDEDRDRVWDEVQRALKVREPFQVVYRFHTAKGTEKWALERGRGVYSVFSESGELLAIEGFISDVTESKRAEELLSEYSQRLKAEVGERTRELERSHHQLMIQERLASLGALTAGIAHEIKNPLNFVNNFAEMSVELATELSEEIENQKGQIAAEAYEEIRELIDALSLNAGKIQEHGKRANSIMGSMLLHSRGSSGERRMENLNALLEEDLNLAYHGMRAQDLSFNVALDRDLDPQAGEIEIVRQDVGRVFLNLVNNACQATHRKQQTVGGDYRPVVRVSTKAMGDRVEIRIRDNGTGIPENIRSQVFSPFFTTKPAGEGTGLGLSIAYETIVQDHGGTLDLDTVEGEYAEFIIGLPRKAPNG